MPAAQHSNIGQLGQRAGVEKGYIWVVGAQDDRDSSLLDVGGDDSNARITPDQVTQPSSREIVEVGKDNGDGGLWWHGRSTRGLAA